MEKKELIGMLKTLVQMDIDTVQSYNRALDEIPDMIIRGRLTEFRDDHLRHITELSEEIRSLGGQPPEMTKDFKGYVIAAFTVLQTVTGMKGALKALKSTEEIANRYYAEAIPKAMPPALKEILRKQFSDERNHLEYINNNLQVL